MLIRKACQNCHREAAKRLAVAIQKYHCKALWIATPRKKRGARKDNG